MDDITNYPKTLGAYAREGWRMQGLCVGCNGIDKFEIDMAREALVLGKDYPTYDFMLAKMCSHCGKKLSLYTWSPEEFRDNLKRRWRDR